jgi:cell wall integrity and stress response component
MHSSPTESATMSKDKDENGDDDSFFDNKGKVAGTFTAVGIVAAGLILALIFFLCYRKRKRAEADGSQTPSSYSGHSPNPLNEKGATGLQRDQSNATTLAGMGYDEKGRLDNTTIVPITVDQRLDPGQMFMRWDQNDSRRSLQDEHDYSRKLRVTNPDYDRNSSLYDE